MVSQAHDVAALAIKGNSGYLNFPKLSGFLPRPVSCSPTDIQVATAKAAKVMWQEPVIDENLANEPSHSELSTAQSLTSSSFVFPSNTLDTLSTDC
ncbi:unnamed protein product [Brassica oleracea var. botrytis]|uniref:AP2/ERF domain-containing protein n=1 Tax=Brassica oleracea var. oleracea TaxID=109376 RepID=A0A0D3CUY4_BRAOL